MEKAFCNTSGASLFPTAGINLTAISADFQIEFQAASP